MARAPQVSGDDDRIARSRPRPEQDPVLPHPAERGAGDREDVRLLRVPAQHGDPEFADAFLHPRREAAKELHLGIGRHR